MAISPASPEPAGFPRRDHADAPPPGRRISRWVIKVLLLAVALLTISTPALAATHATHATHATTVRLLACLTRGPISPATFRGLFVGSGQVVQCHGRPKDGRRDHWASRDIVLR